MMFKLKNLEFSYEVDVSQLPCGLNGALYFVEMEKDGGKKRFSSNKAGAAYGTGYCDAQCPHDLKFINGEVRSGVRSLPPLHFFYGIQANMLEWKATSGNSGTGKYGSCCNEMDIWEANSESAAFTPHVCTKDGAYSRGFKPFQSILFFLLFKFHNRAAKPHKKMHS